MAHHHEVLMPEANALVLTHQFQQPPDVHASTHSPKMIAATWKSSIALFSRRFLVALLDVMLHRYHLSLILLLQFGLHCLTLVPMLLLIFGLNYLLLCIILFLFLHWNRTLGSLISIFFGLLHLLVGSLLLLVDLLPGLLNLFSDFLFLLLNLLFFLHNLLLDLFLLNLLLFLNFFLLNLFLLLLFLLLVAVLFLLPALLAVACGGGGGTCKRGAGRLEDPELAEPPVDRRLERGDVGVEVAPGEGEREGRAGGEDVEGLAQRLLLRGEGGDGGLHLPRRHLHRQAVQRRCGRGRIRFWTGAAAAGGSGGGVHRDAVTPRRRRDENGVRDSFLSRVAAKRIEPNRKDSEERLERGLVGLGLGLRRDLLGLFSLE
uniref:Uncharacterized protein n=1 Tax=Oryza barthii TaxID=65489 RepID=A0A0D3FKW5_9ORYZ